MPAYYAVTQRHGQWIYLYAGDDPEAVYRQGLAVLDGDDRGVETEQFAHSPDEEWAIDALRVVTEATARGLRLTYPQMVLEE